MNLLQNTTALARSVCLQYAKPQAAAVDATCGRGRDTLWLASCFRKVYAFDIQQEALNQARLLLQKEGHSNVAFIHDSHENMKKYIE